MKIKKGKRHLFAKTSFSLSKIHRKKFYSVARICEANSRLEYRDNFSVRIAVVDIVLYFLALESFYKSLDFRLVFVS